MRAFSSEGSKDYYGVLGVKREASAREIKRAYRKLVRKWHPDFHPDDPTCLKKIQEINEAYEVLSNPEKRRAYNRQGEDWRVFVHGQNEFYTAYQDHPFFSYFSKLKEMYRKGKGK